MNGQPFPAPRKLRRGIQNIHQKARKTCQIINGQRSETFSKELKHDRYGLVETRVTSRAKNSDQN
jgi:hypothetical protein